VPRLLTLCFPTFGRDNFLQFTSTGKEVVLAPDEFHACLISAGWRVDVVSLADPTDLPLFRSGLKLKTVDQVDFADYDLCWHMFRDPTQPEVLEMLEKLSLPSIPTINNAQLLANHHKYHYLRVLQRFQMAPELNENLRASRDWKHCVGTNISPDQMWLDSNAYNNNRGDYPSRGHGRAVTRFVDNMQDGLRRVVRFGVAFGQGFQGFQYYSPDIAFKSGAAVRWEPYAVPLTHRPTLAAALQELGCDVCHVEAVPQGDRLFVIDINPYPSAHGRTLTPITQQLIALFQQAADEGFVRLRSRE